MRARSIALAVALAACGSDRDSATPPPDRPVQPPAPRREFEPPSTAARLLPPYVITATEVGPYKLRQKMTTVLDQLPKGPRMERFEIPNVIHTSLVRAEDNNVLIGGDPAASTQFVAVINSGEVARTEQGVHVGAAASQLEKLGPATDELERAFAPTLFAPEGMRNARFIVTDDRIAAIVILADAPPRTATTDTACARPKHTEKTFGACLAVGPRLAHLEGEELELYAPDNLERAVFSTRIEGAVFAAALRNPIDGRDELIVISRRDEERTRTWMIQGLRFDAARPSRAIDSQPIYTLTASQARWIGAELRDIDLHLELTSKPDGIEVGGLLTTHGPNGKIRDVIAISPVTTPRRTHTKPPTGEPADAGVPDAEPETKAGSQR